MDDERVRLRRQPVGVGVDRGVRPIVGGALLEHFWVGSVFLINVPVLVVLLVAAPLLVKTILPFLKQRTKRRKPAPAAAASARRWLRRAKASWSPREMP